MKNSFLLLLGITLLSACSIKPEPINYGNENCSFCKMTIMDKKFGSELVTQKGKVFKFDDISCMIKYINISEQTSTDYSHIVVSNFNKTSDFIDTEKAFFVSSSNFQSPMMGNTAAFVNEAEANQSINQGKDAQKLTWAELVKKF